MRSMVYLFYITWPCIMQSNDKNLHWCYIISVFYILYVFSCDSKHITLTQVTDRFKVGNLNTDTCIFKVDRNFPVTLCPCILYVCDQIMKIVGTLTLIKKLLIIKSLLRYILYYSHHSGINVGYLNKWYVIHLVSTGYLSVPVRNVFMKIFCYLCKCQEINLGILCFCRKWHHWHCHELVWHQYGLLTDV